MSEGIEVSPPEHRYLNRVVKDRNGLILGVCVGYLDEPSVVIKKTDGSNVTYGVNTVVPMSELDSLRYTNEQLTAEVAKLRDLVAIQKAMRDSEEYHSQPFEGRG